MHTKQRIMYSAFDHPELSLVLLLPQERILKLAVMQKGRSLETLVQVGLPDEWDNLYISCPCKNRLLALSV